MGDVHIHIDMLDRHRVLGGDGQGNIGNRPDIVAKGVVERSAGCDEGGTVDRVEIVLVGTGLGIAVDLKLDLGHTHCAKHIHLTVAVVHVESDVAAIPAEPTYLHPFGGLEICA